MKTFVMMVLNTIVSAMIGMVLAMVTVGFAEYNGEDLLDEVAVTTKKKAYDQGRRDGVRQAKAEIMANLKAD